MTEAERHDGGEISLFALGSTLLRGRWRIVRWMFIGAVVAALSVISKPRLYKASASFIPEGNSATPTGLASLAGQFGVSLPARNQSLSPEFYMDLLKSGVLLRHIVRDTLVVQELGGQTISFLDLYEISDGTAPRREELGVSVLVDIVTSSVITTTGVVELSVETEWPSVSLAIATALVDGVNDFNRRTRQGQAAAERKFVEQRVAIADAELREAEDRLEHFLVTNRQFGSSPELTFQHDRLQREVSLQQQVFTSLMQSYEDVRIREVRDTPLIAMVEPPSVPTLPEPRGRVRRVQLGLLLGGFVGVVMAFASGMFTRRSREQNAEVAEFVATLGEVRNEVLGSLGRFTGWIRR